MVVEVQLAFRPAAEKVSDLSDVSRNGS